MALATSGPPPSGPPPSGPAPSGPVAEISYLDHTLERSDDEMEISDDETEDDEEGVEANSIHPFLPATLILELLRKAKEDTSYLHSLTKGKLEKTYMQGQKIDTELWKSSAFGRSTNKVQSRYAELLMSSHRINENQQ